MGESNVRRRRRPNPRRLHAALGATWPVVLGTVAVFVQRPAVASDIRDDTPDSLYTSLAAQSAYAASGYVVVDTGGNSGVLGSGTLVAPDWVLTAAHVVTQNTSGTPVYSTSEVTFGQGSSFSFPGPESVAQIAVESGWDYNLNDGNDLALIQLSAPVTNVAPALLYSSSFGSELGQTATMVGYGTTGTGLSGYSSTSYGTRRAIQNVIDAFGGQTTTGGPPANNKFTFSGISSNLMLTDFDQPDVASASLMGGTTPLPLEGVITPGDSGGGVFLTFNGQQYLAGVSDFIGAFDNNPFSSNANGNYGDYNGYTRLSVAQSMNFIDSELATSSTWSGSGGGTWAALGNWNNSSIPEFTGASATFGPSITAASTITLDDNWTVGTVVLNNVNSYTLAAGSGGILTLNNGSSSAAVTDTSGSHFISAPVALESNALFTVSTAGTTLTVSGNVSGSGALTKSGSGALLLSGSNSYSGGSTITAGVAQAGSSNAFGTGVVTVSGGKLDVNGINLTLGGLSGSGTSDNISAGGSPTLTIANAANTTFTGVIQNTTGLLALAESGPAVQVLSGSNTYSGGTSINGGGIEFVNLASIGGSGASVTVNSGGGVAFAGGITSTAFLARVNTNSTGALALTTADATTNLDFTSAPLSPFANMAVGAVGNVTYSGTYTPTGNTYLLGGGGGTLTYMPAISGSSNLQIGNTGSSGVVILPVNETYTGTTTIAGGSLQLGNTGVSAGSVVGPIVDNGGLIMDRADATYNLTNSISGSGSLTQNSASSITYSGNNTYTGPTTINAGVFSIASTSAIGGGPLTINGGVFDLNGQTPTVSSLSGTGTVDNISAGGAATLTVNGTNTSTFGGVIQSTSGVINLVQGGSGTLVLTGANTFSGTTTINGGVLQLGNGQASGSVAGVIVDNSSLLIDRSDLGFTLSQAISGTGGLTQMGPGITVLIGSNSYSGLTTIANGILQIGNGGTTGLVAGAVLDKTMLSFDRSDAAFTFGGTISGSGSVEQSGSGTLILTGTNTYSGGTTVAEGTLQVANPKAFGTGPMNVTGGKFDLNGVSVTVDGLTGSGIVDDVSGGGSPTLTIGGNSQSTFGGVIRNTSGQLALDVASGTAFTITGSNAYTGGTTIQSGATMYLGAGTASGSVAGNIADNGALQFDLSSNFKDTNNISGSGSIWQIGSGTLTLGGNNTNSGGINIIASTLQVGGASALGSGVVNISSGAKLDLHGISANAGGLSGSGTVDNLTVGGPPVLTLNVLTGTATFAGNLRNTTGSLGLTMSGAGEQVLTQASSYSGPTTFASGTLAIASDSAINSGAGGLVFSGGTLQLNNYVSSLNLNNDPDLSIGAAGGTPSQLNGSIGGSSALTFVGPGTLQLNGGNTYGGNTTISGGTLVIGSAGALPTGGSVLNNATLSVQAGTSSTPVVGGQVTGTGALQIGSTGHNSYLQLSALGQTSSQTALNINPGSTLDITNNTVMVNYGTGADPAGAIRSELISGFNASGAKWTGPGIVSSLAAGNPTGRVVGYADGGNATDVANTGGAVTPGEVEIKYTVAGDANLSGAVDLSDLVIIASDFGDSGADWAEGDLNYDGNVDLSDLVIVASNFGASLSTLAPAEFSGSFAAEFNLAMAESHADSVEVPEPASAGLGLIAAGALLHRRRGSRVKT